MAIATLPNPNMDFTPFDILPASDLDKIVANIETVANANIGTSAIENEAVTPSKIKMSELLNVFYPVGSYYETSNSQFDPNTAWGGTWVEDTSGRVTVAQDSGTFLTVGGTGGEETHKLTKAEMPKHTHTQNAHRHLISNKGNTYAPGSSPQYHSIGVPTSPNQDFWEDSYTSSVTATNQDTGGDGAHNNLQPYIVVKRWHRTA